MTPLAGPLAAAGADAATANDVRQLLRERLLVAKDGHRGVSQFAGRGDLRGWVRVAGVREVLRARGAAQRESAVADEVILDRLVASEDQERALLGSQCLDELREVFRLAMKKLETRERNLLRLNLIDGLSIDALGELHGVHRSTAARWLAQAERRLQKEVRRALKDRLSVDTTELAELWRVIESRLEVSIQSLLRSTTSSA
jgi:RNA polymerase sigma-70 factor (ECF subfamily)